MIRKIICRMILLTSVILFSSVSVQAASVTINHIEYVTTSDTTAEVSDGRQAAGQITIPGTIKIGESCYAVTAVGEGAFRENKKIKSVVLQDGIVTLKNFAFSECANLSELKLPETLENIDSESIADCGRLSSIVLPDSLQTVGQCAFSGSGIKSIKIPASVTIFNDLALSGCDKLETIYVDPDNTIMKSTDGILYTKDGTWLIFYPPAKTKKTYYMPDKVTTSSDAAFGSTKYLKTIVFGTDFSDLGSASFQNSSVSCFKVKSGNAAYTAVDGVLYSKDKKTLIYYPTSKKGRFFFVPTECTVIGSMYYKSFEFCKYLKEIYIHKKVTRITDGAFWHMKSLTKVVFAGDSRLKEIPGWLFQSCGKLTAISFPKSIAVFSDTEYGNEFLDCTALKSIYIAKGAKVYSQKSFGSQSLINTWPVLYGYGKNNFLRRLAREFGLEYKDASKYNKILGLTFKDTICTVKVGQTKKNKAVIYPTGLKTKKITYSSSNTSVASVDKDGIITGNRKGKCSILVRAGDGSREFARCKVIVVD